MQVISREILHSMIFAINNYYIGYTALNYKQKTEKKLRGYSAAKSYAHFKNSGKLMEVLFKTP